MYRVTERQSPTNRQLSKQTGLTSDNERRVSETETEAGRQI